MCYLSDFTKFINYLMLGMTLVISIVQRDVYCT